MKRIMAGYLVLGMALAAHGESVELKAAKDAFGRSNERIQNSGGSVQLIVAHAPNIRSIVAFDLSSVTNEIVSAEFRFRLGNTMPEPVSLVVAPMVQTEVNSAWGEGAGNLGVRGQNARLGEACYARSMFPDTSWESAPGNSIDDLGDPALWLPPVAQLKGLEWKEDEWVTVPVGDVAMLEKIRASDNRVVTFGLWGTGGNGVYSLHSKESGDGPKLVLGLKEEPK